MSAEEKAIRGLTLATQKRQNHWQSIQICHDLIKELNNPTKLATFKVRCDKVEEDYRKFEDIQDKILELNGFVSDTEQITDVLSKKKALDDLYFAIKAAQQAQVATTSSNPTTPMPSPTPVKLPQINIPVFDGTYEAFSSFKSLFDTLVHSQTGLTTIEKFSYLKSLLSGAALACIQGFSFSEDNYPLAYQTLVTQFSNKRVVANSICNKLWSFKPLSHDSQLRSFLETFNVSVEAFKAVGIPQTGDFLILYMALRVLDPSTRQAFENSWIGKTPVPQYKDLLDFVRGRVSVSDLITPAPPKPPVARTFSQPAKSSQTSVVKRSFVANVAPPSSTPAKSVRGCPCCSKPHRLSDCKKFLNLTVPEKYSLLKEKHMCFSCFGPHSRQICNSRFTCRQCGAKTHHTLLHPSQPRDGAFATVSGTSQDCSVPSTSRPASPSTNALNSTLSCGLVDSSLSRQVLLGTAIVSVQDCFGHVHDVRALIDAGSMINIITQPLAVRLCLPTKHSNVRIAGIGSSQPMPTSGLASCTIHSKHYPFSLHIDAAVLPNICASIPAIPVSQDVIDRLAGVPLADPHFFSPAPVQMLIGAQYYAELMRTSEPIVPGEPSLVPSNLGVLVMGLTPSSPAPSSPQYSFFVSNEDSDIAAQLRRFWEIEEVYAPVPASPEDIECEKHFRESFRREKDGTYVVRLPFRNGTPPDLGNNRAVANNRLVKLEKRFESQASLKKLYHENIQAYLDAGHMVVADQISSYVLTHHAVIKDSSTTQLRVVFNPAEKASPAHPSLNESLMVGPKLQNDITNIMTNFRLTPIVITCDIKKMYLGIKLDNRDSPYQQILWRSDATEPIQQLEIQRVCFGVASSPYHALRVMKQLIKDEGHRFPLAAKALDHHTYIDDICTGAASIEEAICLRNELIALLATAGFELRKWSSSHPDVLNGLPLDYLEKPHLMGDIETIRVLGLQWDPCQDAFTYFVDTAPQCETKRQVLSQIARIYDLSGFVSPITIWMKILMQRLWVKGFDWDEPMPSELLHEWNTFIDELPVLKNLTIPRYVLDTYVYPPELVGFADASTAAMGAVVYLRVVCSDHRVLVHMIRAKSRVAPLKTLTIPRLELCAAHLLAQVIESLEPLRQQLHINTIHLFSDSMVVLSWLNTPVHLLKIYVANRVGKILDLTTSEQWAHVATDVNPADLASRGCYPAKLVQNELWWSGPTFLKEPQATWPSHSPALVTDLPDMKEPVSALLAQVASDGVGVQIIERFSSFLTAQRVIAWILRFKQNACSPAHLRNLDKSLSVEELNNATRCLIRTTQNHHYASEIATLTEGNLPSSLRQLTPFLENGLLRVGGRLGQAPIPYDSRHPILLPSKSHLAVLIVRHYHASSLHGGPKMVQWLVQRRYYIPGLRDLVRKATFKCITCFRFSAKPQEAFMSDLPVSRFAQGRPFVHTGVDLAGPFTLKDGHRRNSPLIKGYFAIFICFATKAIHLEVLTSLSTDCFLASLDRFIARRGLPTNMFSDQGTNFKGAARILEETHVFLKTNEPSIIDHLSGREIQWTFNAPSNPSSGGLWEAGVKSVKHHLKRILKDRALHYEEFLSALCRCEAILNSRPIGVPASCPVDDVQCLTPGHFLIGAPLLARPEPNVAEVPANRLTRWELLNQVTQHFWKRWAREYLHTLIERHKWVAKYENIKVGDIVVIMIDNQPPMSWPLARITLVHPAQDDGVVRIVTLKTSSGILIRPVRKLLLLPHC
uniref:Integrase catalytic domain-containing protein n=1 Tax=Cacopsylla melanoneura TaxID=428564 RepID=A0A8D9FGG8_9HEMI